MTAVAEKNNSVVYESRPYSEVKKGYTVFQRGDLLWAKITPCMQNGKSCIVDEMDTDIGFGSTEFHVLRNKNKHVYMAFLWAILSNEDVLKAAQATFNGSAGQQRVSDAFLKRFPAVLPNYDKQVLMVEHLMDNLKDFKRKFTQADELLNSMDGYVLDVLGLAVPDFSHKLSNAVTLGTVKRNNTLNADYYHPERLATIKMMQKSTAISTMRLTDAVDFCRDIVSATDNAKRYIGLASVQSNTGELLDIEEEAAGQAFTYELGDVLYGRLRPYLNKVFVAETSGICSTEFHVMRSRDNSVLADYLSVILRSNIILSQTKHMMTGNTHPRIANNEVENLLIPIPSKDIQKQIADEAICRRTLARQLKEEANRECQAAKARFEKELLGE